MNTPVYGAIHMHSDYSHDGHDSLEQLREVCLERHIRFVGITDHAEDLDAEVFGEYLKHCDELSDSHFRFIPGLEYRFAGLKGLHLLAIGLREWIEPRTPEEFLDQASRAARFTVLAHPVLAKYQIPDVVLERIDAIEVWNANYNTRYLPDPRSIALVHKLREHRPELVATVGLDQHDSSNDRELRTVITGTDFYDPVAALRAGRFTCVGRIMSFDSHATLTPGRSRWLSIARPALDTVNGVHDRAVRALRRIGVE